jgi:hypothetical protein
MAHQVVGSGNAGIRRIFPFWGSAFLLFLASLTGISIADTATRVGAIDKTDISFNYDKQAGMVWLTVNTTHYVVGKQTVHATTIQGRRLSGDHRTAQEWLFGAPAGEFPITIKVFDMNKQLAYYDLVVGLGDVPGYETPASQGNDASTPDAAPDPVSSANPRLIPRATHQVAPAVAPVVTPGTNVANSTEDILSDNGTNSSQNSTVRVSIHASIGGQTASGGLAMWLQDMTNRKVLEQSNCPIGTESAGACCDNAGCRVPSGWNYHSAVFNIARGHNIRMTVTVNKGEADSYKRTVQFTVQPKTDNGGMSLYYDVSSERILCQE